MIEVDPGDLVHEFYLIAVMSERMMAVTDAKFPISPRRSYTYHQESDHTREIRLERNRDHVGHQLEVLGKILRNAVRLFHVRIDLHVIFLRLFDLQFDVAN